MEFFYKTALALHYIGFVTMAGTTLAHFIAYRQFWKLLPQDASKAIILQQATKRFPMFIGLGAIVLISAGISMMVMLRGAMGSQVWFQVKMILVILVAVNGSVIGGRALGKLQGMLNEGKSLSDMSMEAMRKKINFFHVSQISMLLLIFILSAFRFN